MGPEAWVLCWPWDLSPLTIIVHPSSTLHLFAIHKIGAVVWFSTPTSSIFFPAGSTVLGYLWRSRVMIYAASVRVNPLGTSELFRPVGVWNIPFSKYIWGPPLKGRCRSFVSSNLGREGDLHPIFPGENTSSPSHRYLVFGEECSHCMLLLFP
jgi:hypothetical protein